MNRLAAIQQTFVVPVDLTQGDTSEGQRRLAAWLDYAHKLFVRRGIMPTLQDILYLPEDLSLCLSPRVPTQDVAFVLARLLANPAARERAWAFAKRRWARLAKRMPPMLASRLVEATPALGTAAHRRDVAAFFRRHPLPAGARALEQALERFDLDAAFCRVARPGLARWLAH